MKKYYDSYTKQDWAKPVHFARMYFTLKQAEKYAKEFQLTYKEVKVNKASEDNKKTLDSFFGGL